MTGNDDGRAAFVQGGVQGGAHKLSTALVPDSPVARIMAVRCGPGAGPHRFALQQPTCAEAPGKRVADRTGFAVGTFWVASAVPSAPRSSRMVGTPPNPHVVTDVSMRSARNAGPRRAVSASAASGCAPRYEHPLVVPQDGHT